MVAMFTVRRRRCCCCPRGARDVLMCDAAAAVDRPDGPSTAEGGRLQHRYADMEARYCSCRLRDYGFRIAAYTLQTAVQREALIQT